MKDFKNKFEEVLKEELNFDPSAEDAAFQNSLDDDTAPEEFNTPGMPPGTGTIDKAVEGVEEVKRWISVIDKFVTYVNGDQDTSVVKKLASLDQDDTAWAGVVSDAKTIINIAGKLAEYKQKLQGRISTIDHKVKQLQAKKNKVNS